MAINYYITKDLAFTTSAGYNNTETNDFAETTIASQDPNSTTQVVGSSVYTTNKVYNWIVEPQLRYSRLISKGSFNATAGLSYQVNATQYQEIHGQNYTSDVFLKSLSLAPQLQEFDGYQQYKYLAAYAILNYTWEQKYVINFNGRRDGSSRFGPGSQFGNFGSVGWAWLADQEKFIKNFLPSFFSTVKFHGSYGLTGSDNVANYSFLSQYGNASLVSSVYNGVTAIVPLIDPNSNFHWQVNKKLELGFNLGLFHDDVTLGLAWYRDRCNNQLLDFPIPALTGFTSVVANTPANVQNTGLEFTFGYNIHSGVFNTSLNLDFSINHNKLLSYPNLAQSPYAKTLKIGQDIQNTYIFKYTGVDPLTGLYTVEDHDHNGITTPTTGSPSLNPDQYLVFNLNHKFNIGLNPNFSYKNISLSFSIYIVKQQGRELLSDGTSFSNVPLVFYQNHWQYPGQKGAIYSGLVVDVNNNNNELVQSSDFGYEDASFIRLQNLSVAYDVPERVAKKVGLKGLSFHATSYRLFTFTRYNGLDPELQSDSGEPLKQTVSFGVSATF